MTLNMKQRLELLIDEFWESTNDFESLEETLKIAKNQELFNKFFLSHYITPDIFRGSYNANNELFKYAIQNNLPKLEKQSQIDLITKYYKLYGFEVPQKTLAYYEKASTNNFNQEQFYYDPNFVEMLCCKYLALTFINDYSKPLYNELKQRYQQFLKGN